MSTFQQVGNVAKARVVGPWAWWQNALKGEFGPIHDGHPEQGYYRARRKGEPWEPVAIWQDESGSWLAYRAGKEVRAEDIWTWCCRTPITVAAYDKAMAGGGFDDEPPAPTVGDNSGDVDPFDAIRIELAGEAEQVADFLKSPVTTQAAADRLGIWSKRLTDLAKRADNHRTIEKEPHLTASRDVDAKWRPLVDDAKDWSAKAKKATEAFLIAKKREEKARAAAQAAEAARLRREAEEAARAAQSAPEIDENAEAERAEMIRRAEEAERAAEVRNATAGRTGARVALRTEKIGVVTDYAKAAAALVAMNHKDIKAVIDQLAQRAAKAGMPFDGMAIETEERVV